MLQSIPVLSHIFETDLGILGWVTLQGRVGITVACFTRDLDMTDLDQWTMQLSQRIRFLSPKVLLKITASTEISHQTEFTDFSRHGAVEKIGYSRHKLFLTLQTTASLSPQRVLLYAVRQVLSLSEKKNDFLGESKLLLEQLSALDLGTLGLEPRGLSEEEIEDLFKPSRQNAVPTPYGVDLGDEVVGVVKLTELLSEGVPFHFIALIRESIPKPYEIIFSVKTRGVDVGFQLEKFESNAKGMPSAKASEKLSKISDAKSRFEHRETFLDLELSIVLKRSTDQILRPDLGKVTRILSGLGKVSLETYGGFSSWKATLEGSTQHMRLMETEGAFGALAPLLTRGNSFEANELKKGTLALHRLDGSLFCYHPFGKKKNNANAIIVGPPNSGKSSLLTLKTMALAHDPNQIFIKGDVGGSYLSECKKLGGVMYNIGMNSHSGIRTFEVISDLPHDLYICSTLSGFLQTFIQERNEDTISKDMASDIEKAVLSYSDSRPRKASIDDFLLHAKEFPRKKILQRWASGGIYESFLKPIPGEREKNRYRCYNLTSIEQAEDEDFMQGAMAALLVDYNFEIALKDSPDKRINLEIDEAKTMINRCGPLLLLKGANNRKQGGALTLAVQNSSWLKFNRNDAASTEDEGLYNLMDSHWLFAVDGDEEEYKRRHRVSDEEISAIQRFRRDETTYRDVLLRDSEGSKIIRIMLSPRELWTVGSNKDRKATMTALMSAVPGLTEEEAITCLARDFF